MARSRTPRGHSALASKRVQYPNPGPLDIRPLADARIFRESPNAFLCVSSFNPDARRLYERLGYERVGELRDYLVAGHSEVLMRKTRGPIRGYAPER